MPLTLRRPVSDRRLARLRRAASLFRAATLLALAGLIVASCSSTNKKGVCPRIAILAQAGELTELASDNRIAYQAEVADVRVECEFRSADMVEMTADITTQMRVTKGPGMQGDTASFQYFVSVTDRRGNVLNKRVFPVTVNFQGRQSVVVSDDSWQFYRMRQGGTGLAYEIWVGFQLTDGQLEFNRRKGTE